MHALVTADRCQDIGPAQLRRRTPRAARCCRDEEKAKRWRCWPTHDDLRARRIENALNRCSVPLRRSQVCRSGATGRDSAIGRPAPSTAAAVRSRANNHGPAGPKANRLTSKPFGTIGFLVFGVAHYSDEISLRCDEIGRRKTLRLDPSPHPVGAPVAKCGVPWRRPAAVGADNGHRRAERFRLRQ